MADSPAPSTWTQRITAAQQISQTLAILVGGIWIVYTFILKENTKSYHITPSLEVHAVGSPEKETAGGKFHAFELILNVNNGSERDSYIIAGIVEALGHRSKDTPNNVSKTVNTANMGPQLIMRAVDWFGDAPQSLATVVTFPKFGLSRGDKATQRYVLLIPATGYDILELWVEFHVVQACKYVYPFDQCYEFFVKVGPQEPISFRYSRAGANPAESTLISADKLRKDFDYKVFQTTHMLILPGADILKLK